MNHFSMDTPYIILPTRNIFLDRAMRYKNLAQDHPQHDWLLFLSHIAQVQYDLWEQIRAVPAHQNQQYPFELGLLNTQNVDDFMLFFDAIEIFAPIPLQKMIQELKTKDASQLLFYLENIFSHEFNYRPQELLMACVVQLKWTKAASQFSGNLQLSAESAFCPISNSEPTMAYIDAQHGLRYLYSIWSNVAWHYVRAKCTFCDSNKPVLKNQIDDKDDILWQSVYAECCEHCQHYLKVISRQKNMHADPVADDVASVNLDVLLSETEYSRGGFNPFMIV